MATKTERQLHDIKSQVRAITSEMDKQTAVGFLSDLADWAYTQSEELLYDDEPAEENNSDNN